MLNLRLLLLMCTMYGVIHCYGNTKYFSHFIDPQHGVLCNSTYLPQFCITPDTPPSTLGTVEDFERCGPAARRLAENNFAGRNYFWGAGGRKISYYRNIQAYDKFQIRIRNLRGVPKTDLSTSVLGQWIAFPIGLAPAAAQELAHPYGERASARAAASLGTIMILSTLSSANVESVSSAAYEYAVEHRTPPPVLWMQIYILNDRSETLQIALRAKAVGFTALVMTCDAPMLATISCDAGSTLEKIPIRNLYNNTYRGTKIDRGATFSDITWLTQESGLPVVAKGIINGDDAIAAIEAGAVAILVSNHGGRQEDTVPPTIEVLQEVISTVHAKYPDVEIYMDSGIRAGQHVFKALAMGARATFVGRAQLWGLAIDGEDGVRQVLSILKQELNETMILAGVSRATDINPEHLFKTKASAVCY